MKKWESNLYSYKLSIYNAGISFYTIAHMNRNILQGKCIILQIPKFFLSDIITQSPFIALKSLGHIYIWK